MSSDSTSSVTALNERFDHVNRKFLQLQARRDMAVERVSDLESEITSLRHKGEVFAKVSELFRVLLDRLINRQVQVVQDTVTSGFKSIFTDMDLSMVADVGTLRNKVSVDLNFVQVTPTRTIKEDPLSAFGGGAVSIASLILRVLTMLRKKQAKLLVMDEALIAVANKYVENTGLFLRALARETGIDILLVTHDTHLGDMATNRIYGSSSPKDGSLVLKAHA